ncbi:MAG: hypothetical protein ACRD0H_04495, partial [Actinomycetes bacterium]
DLVAQLLLTPDEIPAFTAGSPLNTDDNALIEFQAPRDLLGSTRTADPYLARVYGTEWPYGRFDRRLVLGRGPARASDELALARSLLEHGRRTAAERFVRAARRHGAPAESTTERLVQGLGERAVSDREVPLTDAPEADTDSGTSGLQPPIIPAGVGDAEPARIARDYLEVERAVRKKKWASALMALRRWPERYIDEGGPDLELLVGYLLYKADLASDAVDRLKPLMDDKGFVEKRPSLLYYLARAEYGAGIFEAAVRNMDRWLSAATRKQAP